MKSMNFLHVLAYVGAAILGLLTYLSTFDPTNLAFISATAVKDGTIAVAVAAAILTALHQAGVVVPGKKTDVTTVARVILPLVLVLPFLGGCAGGPKPIALPTLSTAQLQALTRQVCTALNTDLVLLEGPTGKALLTPSAMTKVTTIIGPTITAVCSSGASVDVTSLQTLNNTVVPALIDLVAAVPGIPDQPEILAGLTLVQVALVPVVNQAIAAAQAAASSAPSSAPAPVSSAPTALAVPATDVPAQNRHFVLAAVESPQAVGASAALVLIGCLQAFEHISVNAPTGAAITVLFTVAAAAIDNLIS